MKECKQGDAFKEKLCQRFESLHEANAATAAELAAAAQVGGEPDLGCVRITTHTMMSL